MTDSTEPTSEQAEILESSPLPPAAPMNSLAIVGFVLSLFGFISGIGFIAGIVCGHISLSQIKRTHESGRGLAIAALIIGYIMVGVLVLLLAVGIVLFALLMMSHGVYDPDMGQMHMRWNS